VLTFDKMADISYREGTTADSPALAKIRSAKREAEPFWNDRISGYMNGTHDPQQALKPRVIYVAVDGDSIIGFVAGHVTTRHACEGELQWIDVMEEYRRRGIASELVSILAKWFAAREVGKICIDPGNETARRFYRKLGATDLDQHWMMWSDIKMIRTNQ
jgi:ribosomal protein S18 acetylase RimI-like enzyme